MLELWNINQIGEKNMVRQLNKLHMKILMNQINGLKVDKHVFHIPVNKTVGAEMIYDNTAGTFDLDILELPFEDNTKGLANYSHGFPPCLVPTAIKLLKEYVNEHGGTFKTLRSYEMKTGDRFSNYFEQQTGVPYDDLVMYEP